MLLSSNVLFSRFVGFLDVAWNQTLPAGIHIANYCRPWAFLLFPVYVFAQFRCGNGGP